MLLGLGSSGTDCPKGVSAFGTIVVRYPVEPAMIGIKQKKVYYEVAVDG
jgi:hypothetical protein